MSRIFLFTWLLWLYPTLSYVGEYNKKLNLGDAAPIWKDLPGIDGKKHSLTDFKDKDVLVVIFTCNSCPIAEDYEDRIVSFSNKNSSEKVGIVAINVNTIPEDRLPAMKKRAEEKKFTFPYLYDETQRIAKDFGARFTPEFFVLNKNRKVVYMGAMDDTSTAEKVKENYLQAALDATLKGEKPSKGETLGRGCQIRFKRSRD